MKTQWNGTIIIVDQCKQRGALCMSYTIGLAKDRGGHLVNQPRLSFFDKCWETTVGRQISIMKRKTKKRMNAEHPDQRWWRKCTGESACLYVHRTLIQHKLLLVAVAMTWLVVNSSRWQWKLQNHKIIAQVKKKNYSSIALAAKLSANPQNKLTNVTQQ